MSNTADRYLRLATRYSSLVDAVAHQQSSASTPCAGWTVSDIVDHVTQTQLDLLMRQPFAPQSLGDESDQLDRWSAVRDAMHTALSDPTNANHRSDGFFGPTTFAETVDTFYCLDLVVHAWDIAVAAGRDDLTSIEPAEMDRIRSSLEPIESNMGHPGLFEAQLSVPDSASAQTKFLAFLGRADPHASA